MSKHKDIKLGNFIRDRRECLALTQQDVADYVGITKSAVSRWESGEIGNMGLDKIGKLSDILEISPLDLINLDKKDITDRVPNKSNTNPIPLLGTIAAGAPLLAEEHIEDYFNLDSSIDADFALRVKGDSMLGADIFPGDIVFLRKQPNLENGEIGAILIENEATLKKFYEDNGTVILQAENDKYQPIILTNGYVKVLGKLVAVLSMRD